MCFGMPSATPAAAPAPVPLKQAAKAPDGGATTAVADDLRRRIGLASTIMTGPSGLTAAPVTTSTGKTTLGS